MILAFDVQNEPMIASSEKLKNNDPDDWVCGRATSMRKVLGNSVGWILASEFYIELTSGRLSKSPLVVLGARSIGVMSIILLIKPSTVKPLT